MLLSISSCVTQRLVHNAFLRASEIWRDSFEAAGVPAPAAGVPGVRLFFPSLLLILGPVRMRVSGVTTVVQPVKDTITVFVVRTPIINCSIYFHCTVCLGSTKYFFFRFPSLLLLLARLEDMAKRRTLLEDERLGPKIEWDMYIYNNFHRYCNNTYIVVMRVYIAGGEGVQPPPKPRQTVPADHITTVCLVSTYN